jgi:hypothetical protein
VRLEGFGKLKKFSHLIGSRTRDLAACGIMPQALCYRMPPMTKKIDENNHYFYDFWGKLSVKVSVFAGLQGAHTFSLSPV